MTSVLSQVNGRKTLITLPESGGGSGGILTASASNLIWCIAGGSYATGQAAVNAASDGQTVLLGPKPGGWGDIVLPVAKKINLVGLQGDRGLIVEIKSLSFSPDSSNSASLNINQNQIAVNNLYINQTAPAASALSMSGDRPGRFRLYGCYINSSGGSADLITGINSHSSSSLYLENCNIDAGSAGRTAVNCAQYVRMRRCDVSGGSKSLLVSAGTFEAADSNFECNQTAEVISLTGGSSFLGKCVIKNTVSNGSGILMASPAFLSFGASGFAVNSGTGYCIRGTGTVLYDRLTFSHSALQAQNVKIQNTITLLIYTTAATVTA